MGSRRNAAFTALVFAVLVGCCAVTLFPLLWTLSTSLKPREAIFAWPPTLVPLAPTAVAYAVVLQKLKFAHNLLNTFLVSAGTVAVALAVGSLAAFRFARGTFRGKNIILFLLIATIMIPGLSNLIPLYVIMKQVGLLNTRLALILIYTAGDMPVVIWLLKSFIEGIPAELDESAMMDGAGRWTVYTRIILPLARSGLIAAATLVFVAAWNEFLVALTFVQTPAKRTMLPAIQLLVGYYEATEWTYIAAAAMIACIPIVIVFLFLQRSLVTGLTAGAVKR